MGRSGHPEPTLRAAAIRHDGSIDVDALLWALAAEQRRRGHRVRGLLMTYPEGNVQACAPMVLVDLAQGGAYRVSQELGSGSASCRADTQGFAQASAVLRQALHDAPDLVVVNRFGGLEAEGGGFAAELLDLLAAGVPLLTAVATRHEAAWERFTGGAAWLPARQDAVQAWLDQVLAAAGADTTTPR